MEPLQFVCNTGLSAMHGEIRNKLTHGGPNQQKWIAGGIQDSIIVSMDTGSLIYRILGSRIQDIVIWSFAV